MKRVQDALAPVGIPVFAGSWRKTPANPKVPDRYMVYTTMAVERDFWDDGFDGYRVYVYLNLYTNSDPTSDISDIRAAMRAGGFAMSDERDGYDEDADMFRVSWTWVCREAV